MRSAFGCAERRRCASSAADSGGCSARETTAFDARVVDAWPAPHAERDHAIEHLVARDARGFRMAIRAQAARRLRQHRQQCRFGLRQARGRLAEISPARGFDALDRAAERRAFEIQREDLASSTDAPRAAARATAAWPCPRACAYAGRGCARPASSASSRPRRCGRARSHLPACAQQRRRIDAGMAPEPAVFVVEQRLQVQRRDALRRGRIAPDALAHRRTRATACRRGRRPGCWCRGFWAEAVGTRGRGSAASDSSATVPQRSQGSQRSQP